MKRTLTAAFAILAVASLGSQSTQAAARTWANIGTDFNAGASWGGTAPGSNDVALFASAPTMQPNLTANLIIGGIRLSDGSSGYDLTSTGGFTLTLNGVSVTGSGGTTTASASAFRNDNVSGTTTVDAALNLAPSTSISTIFQDANDGSTLILNGAISQTGTVNLSLKNGTIQLNGNNSFATASVDAAGTIVVVGSDNGLGAGTFTINNTSSLQAGGGARVLANNMVYAADTTISGGNAFTLNGTVTSSGSNSRIWSVTNTGGVTVNGNVFLSDSNTLARSLNITGSSAVTINGVVTNNNVGNTLASSLKYGGTGTLTLSNTNTYTGGTSINLAGGTVVANHDGALGSGNVSLTAGTVTLTLQNGATNNYIGDSANLSIFDSSTDSVKLSYSGTDTVNGLIINGVGVAAGQWGAVGSGAANQNAVFTGAGFLNVLTQASVPEPSTWAMLILGATSLVGLQMRRKRS